MNAYQHIRVLDENVNPVSKVQLVIWGEEGEVFMDEVAPVEQQPPDQNPNQNNTNNNAPNNIPNNIPNNVGNAPLMGVAAGRGPAQQQPQALNSQVHQLQRGIDNVNTQMGEDRARHQRVHQQLTANVRRMATQPVRVRQANQQGQGGAGGGGVQQH